MNKEKILEGHHGKSSGKQLNDFQKLFNKVAELEERIKQIETDIRRLDSNNIRTGNLFIGT